MLSVKTSPAFSCGGSGTASDPYLLCTLSDMDMLANAVNEGWPTEGKYFKVQNDIGTLTATIGTNTYPFKGNFDGNGKTLTITRTVSANYNGLFGYVGAGANIHDVRTSGNITGGSYSYIGGIVGYAYGSASGAPITIENCTNGATINGTSYYRGGIVGYANYNVHIANCTNTGTIYGSYYVGGICGYMYASQDSWSTISGCSNSGYISTSSYHVGGVVGYTFYCNIDECSNTGTVASSSYNVGGVVGNMNYSTLRNSYNRGAVSTSYSSTGTSYGIGGVAGYVNGSSTISCYIENCYNIGTVTASSTTSFCVGGVVGRNSYGYIRNCYTGNTITVNTSNTSYSGNVCGYNYTGGYVQYCHFRSGMLSVGTADRVCGTATNAATNSYPFTHSSLTDATCTLGTAIDGSTVLVSGLNYWCANVSENAADCMQWVADASPWPNNGMPVLTHATCPAPINVQAANVTANSATIMWDGSASSYSVRYRPESSSSWTTRNNVQGTELSIDQLSAYTVYKVQVQANCGNDGTSLWGNVYSFRTEPAFSCGGTGTASDPFLICTLADMNLLANATNEGWPTEGKYFKVQNNISTITLTIGTSTYPFKGNFDGNGKSLTLGISQAGYAGLFGYIGSGAHIHGVVTSGSVTSTSNYCGGIVGYMPSSSTNVVIANCTNGATISGTMYVGGIVGYAYGTSGNNCTIENCSNIAAVTGASNNNYRGGIAGYAYYTDFISCSNTGAVSGTSYLGSIAGQVSYCTFTNCANTIDISGTSYLGGIAGQGSYSTFTNCVNKGKITGSSCYVGGICGYSSAATNYPGRFISCTNSGTITGTYSVAGIVGYLYGGTSYRNIVTNCANTGAVSGTYNLGGVVGYTSYTDVNKCSNTGSVTSTSYAVGGIAGYLYSSSTIKNSYNRGAVKTTYSYTTTPTTSNYSYGVGGIAGASNGSSASYYCYIDNCYNTGTVTGSSMYYVGGIVGRNQYSYVRNCYSGKTISGNNTSYTGSIVGCGGVSGTAYSYIQYCHYRSGQGADRVYGTNYGSSTYCYSVTHSSESDATCTLSSSVGGNTVLVDALNYWRNSISGNAEDYMPWGADASPWANKGMPVHTLPVAPAASVPYTHNFDDNTEENDNWTLNNGSQTNYWTIGSGVSNSSPNALYITNDGSNNAYTVASAASYVYAYRLLSVTTAGYYTLSFNWKAYGEGNTNYDYDLLRVFMIPESTNPNLVGGTNNGQSSSTNTIPAGWIDVVGKLYKKSDWQESVQDVYLTTGNYYLVFFWKNDGSSGTQPPAAVDNISLTKKPDFAFAADPTTITEGESTTLTANAITNIYTAEPYIWDWNENNYTGNDHISDASAVGGMLSFKTTGNDPKINMYNIGSFDPTVYKYIKMRYRVIDGSNPGNVEIFFVSSSGGNTVEATTGYSCSTSLTSDSQWHIAEIDMSNHNNNYSSSSQYGTNCWIANGNVTGWRLDPCGSSNTITMQIDWIGLFPDAAYTNVSTQTVTPAATTTYCARTYGDNILGMHTANQTVTVVPTPASVPYACTFENTDENQKWSTTSGSTDGWFIGTAAYSSSSHSLYVSADNGATNTYGGSSHYIYAYRELSVADTCNLAISYKWRCAGESSNDYLRVFLIPASISPDLSGSTSNNISSTGAPDGWIAVDGNTKLNLNGSSWTTVNQVVHVTSSGDYYLVFYWRTDGSWQGNDGSHPSQNPPAAVDDIVVMQVRPMVCGTEYSGTLGSTGVWNNYSLNGTSKGWSEPGEEHVYMFTTTTYGTYTFTATTASGDPDFYLLSSLNNDACIDYWNTDNKEVSLSEETTYFIVADNFYDNSTSGYTLNVTCPEVCDKILVDGNGATTSTSYYLPFYNYYQYNYSQQIYTPCEIGTSGTISSISFYNKGSYPATRTIDIWLAATDKASFSSTSDWIPISSATKVYTGTAARTIQAGEWATFYFDTPFAYDGQSNLAVIIDDNTGVSQTGTYFATFTTSSTDYHAMYYYNSSTNFNPSSPATASNRSYYKNQVKFGMCDQTVPTATISATVNTSGAGSVTGAGPYDVCSTVTLTATPTGCYKFKNWTEGGTEVSADATYTFEARQDRNLVANFEEWTVSINSTPTSTSCITSGTSVTLNASTTAPNPSYSWSTGVSGSSSISFTPATASNTTYKVSVTSNGCTKQASKSVTVKPATPSILSSAGDNICAGSSTTLTASSTGASSYKWSSNAGSATTAQVTVTPTSSGTVSYTVTATAVNNCTISGSKTITAVPQPDVTIATMPASLSCIASGTSVLLSALVGPPSTTTSSYTIGEGTTNTTYYYPINNYFNYSCTEQIYTANEIGRAGRITSISFYYNYGTAFTAANVTMYLKHVTRDHFESSTDYESLSESDIVWTGTLNPTAAGWLTITLDHPFDYDGINNLLVAFFDGTNGYPGSSYTFYQTATPSSTAMGLSYYSDSDSAIPDPYNLGVYSGSKTTTTYRANIQIGLKEFNSNAEYAWSTNSTASSITVNPTAPTNTYTVTVTANGCSKEVSTTVTTKPGTPAIASSNSDDPICGYIPSTLTATATGASNYNWSTGETGSSITVTPNATTTYTVTASNEASCTTTSSKTVIVTPAPELTLTPDPDYTCITGNTQVVLTATEKVESGLAGYIFSTGTDASKWLSPSLTSVTWPNYESATSHDDHASSVYNIGFTFYIEGTGYTQFSVNSNGQIKLGSTEIGTSPYSTPFNVSNAASNAPKIIGIGRDISTTPDGIKYGVYGSYPNRIFVCQFSMAASTSANSSNIDVKWQVQLFETSNKVQIVYYSSAPSTTPSSFQIGMATSASDVITINPTDHTASEGASSTTYSTWPGANRYYCFTPPVPSFTWAYTGTQGSASTVEITNDTYTVTPAALTNTYTVTNTQTGCSNTATIHAMKADYITAENATINCGETATLTASGMEEVEGITYNWYTNAACTEPAPNNSNPFTTPTLTESTTYYVQAAMPILSSEEHTYSTSGSQTLTIPAGTELMKLEVWGAQGGGSHDAGTLYSDRGGKGGYSVGTYAAPGGGDLSGTLYICVGGRGTDGIINATSTAINAAGGYNGGGGGTPDGADDETGGGGGGATHVAIAAPSLSTIAGYQLRNYSNNKNDVLIVAGGGGGSSCQAPGGGGGGTEGCHAWYGSTIGSWQNDNGGGGKGGGANSGYAFGYGQDGSGAGNGNGVGGGGGGWYGGYINTDQVSGRVNAGGGGSGYLSNLLTDAQTIDGEHTMPKHDGTNGTMTGNSGNGYVRITFYRRGIATCATQGKAVSVTVNQPSVSLAALSDKTICPNGSTSFTASATGDGDISYEWTKPDNTHVSGATCTASVEGPYTVVATATINGCTATDSKTVNLTILHPNVTITNELEDAAICSGPSSEHNFTVVAEGNGTLSYQWRQGEATVGSNSPSFSAFEEGDYTVTVTCTLTSSEGNCTATASSSAHLTVNNAPTIGTLTTPAAVCEGEHLTLTTPSITPNGSIISGAGWQISNGTINNSSPNNWSAFDPQTAVTRADHHGHWLRYSTTSDCGNSYSQAVQITVNAKPTVGTLTAPDMVCTGSTLNLTAPSVEGNGLTPTTGWQISNGNDEWADFDPATSVTDTHDGLSLRYAATNTCGTTYSTNTVPVQVYTPVKLEVRDTTTWCGLPATLSVENTVAGLTYLWSEDENFSQTLHVGSSLTVKKYVEASTVFTYYVKSRRIMADQSACESDVKAVTLTVLPAPAPSVSVNDTAIVCGTDVTVHVTSAITGYKYEWSEDDGFGGIPHTGLDKTDQEVTEELTYYLRSRLADNNSTPEPCVSPSTTVHIGQRPILKPVVSGSEGVVCGTPLTLTVTNDTADMATFQYVWYADADCTRPLLTGENTLTAEAHDNIDGRTVYVKACKYDGVYAADNVICPSETDTVEVVLLPIGNVEELLSYDLGLGEETYHVCQGTEIELAASLDANDDGDPYPYHDRIGNAIPSYVRWYVSENNGEPQPLGDSVAPQMMPISAYMDFTANTAGTWTYYAYAATHPLSGTGDRTVGTTPEGTYDFIEGTTVAGSEAFRITTPVAIRVTSIEVFPRDASQPTEVTVRYTGTPDATPSSDWTSAGTYSIDRNGNRAVTIALNDTIDIPAGSTYSFYLQTSTALYSELSNNHQLATDNYTGVQLLDARTYSGNPFNGTATGNGADCKFLGTVHFTLPTGDRAFGCVSQNAMTTILTVDLPPAAPTLAVEDNRDQDIVCHGEDALVLNAATTQRGDHTTWKWVRKTENANDFEEIDGTEAGVSFSNNGATLTVAVPDATTTYGVYLSPDRCDATDTATVTIHVAVEPEIADITGGTVCAPYQLTVPTISGDPAWLHDGTGWEVSGNGTDFVPFDGTTIGTQHNGYSFRYKVVTACSILYSNTVTFVVDTAAYFKAAGEPEPICSGTSFDFDANADTAVITINSGRTVRTGFNLFEGGQLVAFNPDRIFTYNSDANYYQYNCYIYVEDACGTDGDSIVGPTHPLLVNAQPTFNADLSDPQQLCAGQNIGDYFGFAEDHPDYDGHGIVLSHGWLSRTANATVYDTLSNGTSRLDGDIIADYGMNSRWLSYYVENSCGTTVTNEVQLKLKDTVRVGTITEREPVCAGSSFEAEPPAVDDYSHSGSYTVGWYLSDGTTVTDTLQPGVAMPYEWNGRTLRYGVTNECGTAFSNGVEVKVLPVFVTEFPETACVSHTWDGETYTESGDYTRHYTAANGCDSTVTMHLTINQPTSAVLEVTICDADLPYHYVNGQIDTVFEEGTGARTTSVFTLVSAAGCDSTVTMHLTMFRPIVERTVEHLCNGGELEWHGRTYGGATMADTVLTDTIRIPRTGSVCDSIIYLLRVTISNGMYLDLPQGDEFTVAIGERAYAEANVRGECNTGYGKLAVAYRLLKDGVPVEHVSTYGELNLSTYLPALGSDFGTNVAAGSGEIPGNTFNLEYYDYNYFYTDFFSAVDNRISAVWNEAGEYRLQLVVVQKRYDSGQDYPMTYRINTSEEPVMMGGANASPSGMALYDTVEIVFHVDADLEIEEPETPVTLHNGLISLDRTEVVAAPGTTEEVLVTPAGSGSTDFKAGIDYEITRDGQPVDNVNRYGSVRFETEYPDLHRTFGANITAGTGSIPANTFSVLYYNYDYFYMYFMDNLPTRMKASWNLPGEYKVRFLLREREAGQDLPLTSQNRVVGGHGSVAGGLLAIDSVIFRVAADTVRLTVEASVCEGSAYVFNGHPFTASGDYIFGDEGHLHDTLLSLALTELHPTGVAVEATGCGSYQWNGNTYYNSDTYTFDHADENGCPVTDTLRLTVNRPVSESVDADVCGSYDWDGEPYSVSGDYTRTFTAANGCDSVVTLHLTIRPVPEPVEVTEHACDLYDWDGEPYSVSGDYTKTFTAANGCDSVVTLHLTVGRSSGSLSEVTWCGSSYEWNGTVYDESGTWTTLSTNNDGCPNTDTLRLTLLTVPAPVELTATVCENALPYRYENGAIDTVFEAGTADLSVFTFRLAAANGCDSIVTLQLTVNHPTSGDTTAVACGSFEWYGETFTASGNYPHTFIGGNADGCDSTVTLHLTVNAIPEPEAFVAAICGNDLPYHYMDGRIDTVFEEGTAAGTALFTFASAPSGCPVTDTLRLTVNRSYNDTVAVTADVAELPYLWNGFRLTGSDTVTAHLQSGSGCDSTVTLQLAVTGMPADGTPFMVTSTNNTGDTITLTAFANSTDPGDKVSVDFQLYKDGVPVRDLSYECGGTLTIGTEFQGRYVSTEQSEPIGDIPFTTFFISNYHYEYFYWAFFNGRENRITHNFTKEGDYKLVFLLRREEGGQDYAIPYDDDYTHRIGGKLSRPADTLGEPVEVTFHVTGGGGGTQEAQGPQMQLSATTSDGSTPVYMTFNANGSGTEKVAIRYNVYRDGSETPLNMLSSYGTLRVATEYNNAEYGDVLTSGTGFIPEATFHPSLRYYNYFYMAFLESTRNVITANWTSAGTYRIVFELVQMTGGQDWPLMSSGQRLGGRTAQFADVVYDTKTLTYTAGTTAQNPSATAIADADGVAEGISLYPNPARSTVFVKLPSSAVNAASGDELQLFDLYGQRLRVVAVTGEVTEIDLSGCASGLYLVKLVRNGEVTAVAKVVKQQ